MNPPNIILYAYATSPYAAKVAAVLFYKGLRFEVVHVNPVTKKELGAFPKKVVPTLKIGDEWRQESTDLCLWIESLFPGKSILGEGKGQRNKIVAMDSWVSNNFMPTVFRELIHWDDNYLLWLRDRWRYSQALHQSRALPWYARAAWPWAVQSAGFIRNHAAGTSWDESLPDMRTRVHEEFIQHLGEGPFLGGLKEPSLADFALFPTIVMPWLIGLQRIEHWLDDERIRAWIHSVADNLPRYPYIVDRKALVGTLDDL